MSEKSEWETMWGAKVKTPTDMPDDILKEAITTTLSHLSGIPADDAGDSKQKEAIQHIKEHMDKTWSPCW